jgi:eukaryotic-like serine/threonine-protein kinase
VTSERWKQIEAIFEQALELPVTERTAFVQKSSKDDAELCREVESLLESHASVGSFIEKRSLFFSDEELKEDDDAAVATGQLLGAYCVVREIGRGGMGAVYLAERADKQYKKQVAIKLIKRGMDTDSVLRHFRNERQILAGFDHPNIARLFDGGTTDDGLPYFVMEYVEGLPINEYCAAHQLSLVERLKLFREVCAAVSYAHRHTVIHRDIKMSNILVTSDGTPKLLDFGIAKMLEPGAGAEALITMTGVRPMTPEYASPEQVRGEPVTTTSDVYSLGVVLYELLTGRSPYRFTSRSPLDVAREITDTEPPRPSAPIARSDGSLKSEISNLKSLRGDLDNIVLMALRKEPERRYQSVEQFSDDIGRHLGSRPVLARRDTVAYRTRKFIQRNRTATAAALLILVSLVTGLVATIWQAHRATVQKARAERRFNDVRRLAHSVLFDYHDAIKDLPGATRVRERLVKDALTYLDSLTHEAAGDPTLQRELAAAYERVGDVRGGAFSASLGDRAGALDSYHKALNIREALVAAVPRDVENRRDLAASYKKIGNQLLDTSETARGVEYLRKGLAVSAKLAEEQPENADIRYDLAESYNGVGSALQDSGDTAGALEHLHKALPILEQLLATNPQDRRVRRTLSVTYETIGTSLFLRNTNEAALESNQKAIALREALLAEEPTNADYRRILAVSYQNNGDYRAWAKDTANALESFRKKLAIDERSVAADPANAQTIGDLAYSLTRIGELLASSGDYAQATGHYTRAAELDEKLVGMDRQDVVTPMRLASTCARLATAYAETGKIGPAREQCAKARKILSGSRDDAVNAMAARVRAIAYGDLGEAYAALAANNESKPADWRAAREMYQRNLELLQDLQTRGILDADEIPEIEKVRQKIADCDGALKTGP